MIKLRFLHSLLLSLAIALASMGAQAQLTVEISGAGTQRIPLTIAGFTGEPLMQGGKLTAIIRKDLELSGMFRLIDQGQQPAFEGVQPDFAAWRAIGPDALLVGSVNPMTDGQLEVRFSLFDVPGGNQLFSLKVAVSSSQTRVLAHHIANKVYEKLTGQPGIFSTRIAYVEKTRAGFNLVVADFDGENPQRLFQQGWPEPIMSPTWSPDGKQIAFVDFYAKKPIVKIVTLATGKIRVLSNYKGSNSAPAWSPDGSRLALTLTKDGHSQIYVVNANGSGLRRLMESSGIDTEPRWSPDGSSIYFTSDRGGSPQIYRVSAEGGAAQRISFTGMYNVTPRISQDGKTLVYVSRNEGQFQITMQDLASQQVQVLTDSQRDESPSFAPDGRTILFATEIGGRGVLSVVSIDGRTRYRLNNQAGDVREPTWGPFEK